jgi:steroid delta-isomerase-like uncharacterized protein
MTRAEIVALLERHQQELQRRDFEALAELHSESCTVESPMAGRSTGREGLVRLYRAWLAAFPDAEFTSEEPLIDGDRAARFSTVAGTDAGGFMGMSPTGKRFVMPIVQLFTVAGGVIVHERRIYDFTGLLVQIGVLKAKPA